MKDLRRRNKEREREEERRGVTFIRLMQDISRNMALRSLRS